jgi:hypothetical protein
MPEFAASSGVIKRTDASVATVPWPEIADRLADETYYRVEFKRHGSHDVVDVLVFAIEYGKYFRTIAAFEWSDVSYPGGREKRKPFRFWTTEDITEYPSVTQAVTAAKVDAVLYHAHTRGFERA